MLSKLIKLSIFVFISLSISNAQDLKWEGIAITYLDFSEDKKQIVIKRVQDDERLNVRVSPNNIWSGDFASDARLVSS